MRFQFQMFGEDLLNRDLLRIADRVVNAKPAFEQVLDEVEMITAEQFEGEGKFSGGWTPLKPETIARKQKLGLRLDIEQATGALLDDLTLKTHGSSTRVATATGMERGTNIIYAHAQHKGRADINLPARPLVAFTETHKRGFVRSLQNYVMTGKVSIDKRLRHNR